MGTDLISFHRSCRPEFTELLKHFNILFYGYGCKAALLEALFPRAKIFNLKLQNLASVAEELVLEGFHKKYNATIAEIDDRLAQDKKSLILVLVNFDFGLAELQGLKNIRLIGTVENIDFAFDLDDIVSFNFVCRDLTTFVNYTSEVLDINIMENRVQSTLMVIRSIPNKSKYIFKELLVLGSCDVSDLFNKVKLALMLTRKNTVVEALSEFVDHGIVKIKDGTNIVLCLNKDDRSRILGDEIVKTITL